MDWVKVILASTLVSAVVTWLSNIYLSNQSFKREYHKQLISKRLKAYETAERVLQTLGGYMVTDKGESIPRAFWDRNAYVEFLAITIHSIQQAMWLSHDIKRILENINYLCTQAAFDYQLAPQESKQKDFQRAGLFLDSKLSESRNELLLQLREDFLKIHKIEAFDKI